LWLEVPRVLSRAMQQPTLRAGFSQLLRSAVKQPFLRETTGRVACPSIATLLTTVVENIGSLPAYQLAYWSKNATGCP